MAQLLYFTAEWCGVCNQQKPIVEEIEEETGINVETIDVEEHTDTANKYNVKSLPQMVLKDGETVIKKFTGLTHREEIEAAV